MNENENLTPAEPIEAPVEAPNEEPNETPAEPVRTRRFRPAVLILALLLAACAGLCVYQFLTARKQNEQIKSLEATAAEQQKVLSETKEQLLLADRRYAQQKAAIADLEQELRDDEAVIEEFDTVFAYLTLGHIGYGSESFHVDEGVVVMSLSDGPRQITLYASFPNGGSVNATVYPATPCATMAFDSTSWYTSTTMTITPRSTGISVYTFMNTADDTEFNVIVIVTE